MSCSYQSFKLSLNSLNWIIYFEPAPLWFNLKLELGKELSWHISKSIMSCSYQSFKLSLNSLNWIIYFEPAPLWFNLKLELGKELSWHISKSNHLIGFNDTVKKNLHTLNIFCKFKKRVVRSSSEHRQIY
jgi:hypothetical protein